MYMLLQTNNMLRQVKYVLYMKKIIGVTLLWFIMLSPLLAQNSDEEKQRDESGKSSLWDKIYIGGNFGMQFGYYTYIDISPLIGYRITDRLSAGPGITYRFLKIRGFEPNSTYGGRFFARHTVGRQFFIHTEYESLSTQFVDLSRRDRLVRGWVPSFFVGGGIIQPIGERAAVVIYGLYNLLYDQLRSPYQSPWVFNVGFTI